MIRSIYHKGVKLTQKALALLAKRFERLSGLEKYFVLIRPISPYAWRVYFLTMALGAVQG